MPTISSPGLGSGLDIGGIVSQLVAAEGQPASFRLDRREAEYQAKISALGSLKSSLSDVQSALGGLTAFGDFQGRTASSGDTSIFTLTATADAAPSSYAISVEKLAQSQKLSSGPYTDTTNTVTGGAGGTLTFRFGTYDGASFTVNADKATGSVTIDPAKSSLQEIRNAVNEADIGVTANIINDGSGYHLVFVSDDSGAANSLEISVTDDDGNDTDSAGLSLFAYDPTAGVGSGKNMTENVKAQDAELYIDGLLVKSADNQVNSAIEGLTIDLLSASPGKNVTASITEDTATITNNVDGFVSKYNKFIDSVNSLSSFNAETGEAGILLGNSVLRTVTGQVRGILSSAVSGLDGAYRSLADLGITTQSGGTLAIDKTKLEAALASDPDAVAKVFSAASSATDSLIKTNAPASNAVTGSYAVNVTTLATQGMFNGAGVLPADFAATPLVIDADNNDFVITVDGVQSSTVSLTLGSYNSGDTLAAEIQSRINGDANLKDAGVTVSVGYDSGSNRFIVTSDRYGSESTVEFTSVDTNTAAQLGFSVSAGVTGQDVAGTIGGISATGSGRTLTGSGTATGISFDVVGGSTGSRGSVSVSRGIADQLNTLLDDLLDSDGVINSRTEGLNNSIEDIGEQREALSLRLARLEDRLLAQFSAMDALVAQLQNTGNFLLQQLATLPAAQQNSSG
jgi:flagellar hook-associated protein 2